MDKLPSHFYYLHQKEWLPTTGDGFEDWKTSMIRLLDFHDMGHLAYEPENWMTMKDDILQAQKTSFKQASLMVLNSVEIAVRSTVLADAKYPWEMFDKLEDRFGTPKTLQ